MRLPDARSQPFMSPDEAMGYVRQLSRGSFYNGLKTGEIPSRRVGHRYLIPTAEFAVWAGLTTATPVTTIDDDIEEAR